MNSFPIAMTRVLDSDRLGATRELLLQRANRILGNDPLMSPARSWEVAAATMLANYRRELATLDALPRAQFTGLPVALKYKLEELDESGSYAALLTDLSRSRTLLDDSLVAEAEYAKGEAEDWYVGAQALQREVMLARLNPRAAR